METDLLTASFRTSAAISSVCVFIFGGLIPGVLLTIAATLAAWHRQRAVLARESVQSRARLATGTAVLSGKVQVLDGAPCAVRIRIWQKGFEWKTKNGWGHAWRETDRKIESWPFYLVERGGQRVRIEPGNRVFLVDSIDRADPDSLEEDKRVLTAELSDGESVVADGMLVRDADPHGSPSSYRSAVGTGWVLRPPANDKMLLSSEPLQDRYVKRASMHRRWAWACVAALLALNFLLFGNFHVLSVFGDIVQARVERPITWKTRTKNGGVVNHFGVEASFVAPEGARWDLSDEISDSAYASLVQRRAEAVTIPFRVVPFWPARHQVGTRATLHFVQVVGGFFVNVLLGALYALRSRRTLPWYDKPRVVHSGSGKLSPVFLDP
jgi:hypothetical protein